MSNCLQIDISNHITFYNNKYIINNSINTSYGVFDSNNQFYYLYNIPKNNPIGFYGVSGSQYIYDISNIIDVYVNHTEPYTIYVSRGNINTRYSNGDYFIFYDNSFNIINIGDHNYSLNNDQNYLSNNQFSNFSFIIGSEYHFIAYHDFDMSYTFSILDNSFNNSGQSFNITIPNNDSNIFYKIIDNSNLDNSNNLPITTLKDINNINYYYDNIKFKIDQDYNDLSYIDIYAKSKYSSNGSKFLYYDDNCEYIFAGELQTVTTKLSDKDLYPLYKVITSIKQRVNDVSYTYYFSNDRIYNDISNLEYAVYGTNYILLNIQESYPIRFSNDISNIVEVDLYYPNLNIYKHNNLDSDIYYYGDIRFTVKLNSFTQSITFESPHNNFISPVFRYDILSRKINNLILDNRDISFSLIVNNQRFITNLDETDTLGNNYKLPFMTQYIDPGFKLIDRFGNNLNRFVQTNIPETINDICFNIPFFYIYYRYTDILHSNISGELYRRVDIQFGPIITIGIGAIQDITNLNNTIDLSINLNLEQRNILNDISISAYFFDYHDRDSSGIPNKIYLDYDIDISGFYYNVLTNYNTRNLDNKIYIDSSDKNDYNYGLKYKHNSLQLYNGYYSYLPKQVEYNSGFKSLTINSVDTESIDTTIINSLQAVIKIERQYIIFLRANTSGDLIIDIDEVNNIITIHQNINPDSNQNDILAKIIFDNNTINYSGTIISHALPDISYGDTFEFSFNLISGTNDIFTTGTIPSKNTLLSNSNSRQYTKNKHGFVNSNYKIDSLLVGEYTITFTTKGLDVASDKLYQDFSYVEDYVKQFNSNYSFTNTIKSINVKSVDNIHPEIQFLQDSYNYGGNNNESQFTIVNRNTKSTISDISLQIFNQYFYTNNIPFIYNNVPGVDVSENTIYPTIIDHEIIESVDSNLNGTNKYNLYVVDIFGKHSNKITLDICFNDTILDIELSGTFIVDISVNDSSNNTRNYSDSGIIIDNSFILIPDNIFTDQSNGIFRYNDTYDISFAIDICLDIVNIYQIKYDISLGGNIVGNIIRKIRVIDDTPPTIIFNTITYDDISSLSFNTITNSEHFIFTDGSSINFNINTHINDISLILNSSLTYDISDNYRNQELSGNIKVNVDLTDIDICNNNNLAITVQDRKEIQYIITDACNNFIIRYRYISILDIKPPNIIFTDPIDNSLIAIFSDNNHDFSFSIASSDNIEAYQELFQIINSYDISDNETINSDISININYIKNDISYNITNINTYNDISFIDISNIGIFTLKYTLKDNNNNPRDISRNVILIDNIEPDIYINYNIPDICYNEVYDPIENIVSISHERLLDVSLSNYQYYYTISYEITDTNEQSNIYNSDTLLELSRQIGNYSIKYTVYNSDGTNRNLSFLRGLYVINPGPYIEFSSSYLRFEAGYTIYDLSLIDGVTVRSEYNRYNSIDDPPIIIDSIMSYNQDTIVFNQVNPKVGNYFITYKAIDSSGKQNIRLRNFDISDTEGPMIDSNFDIISIPINTPNQFINQIIDQNISIRIRDRGDNTIDYYITSLQDINVNNPLNTVNILYNDQVISITDITTNNENINNIILRFIIFDNNDVSNSLDISINVESSISNPIITPYIIIDNHQYDITDITDINNLNNTAYADISINYDVLNKTFTLEAMEQYNFNKSVKFNASAFDQYRQDIPSENIFIYNNIESDIIHTNNEYYVIFTCFDTETIPNKSSLLYRFLIVDTTLPIITLNSGIDTILENLVINDTNLNINKMLGTLQYPYIIPEININHVSLNDTRFLYKDSGISIYDIVDKSLNYVADITDSNNDNYAYTKNPPMYNYLEISHKFYSLDTISDQQLNILENINDINDISFLTNSTNEVNINDIRQTRDQSFIQIYMVQDSNYNISYKSKFLLTKRMPPIIILKNTIGGYKKVYHLIYSIYRDNEVAGVIFYDYYTNYIKEPTLSIASNRYNKTIFDFTRFAGDYTLLYTLTNSNGLTTVRPREISVITIQPSKLDSTIIIENNQCIFDGTIINNFEKIGMYLTNNNSGYIITLDSRYLFTFSQNSNISISGQDISGLYYGTIHIEILDNFDRLSINVYDLSRNRVNILNGEDIIIYNEIASIIEFDKIDYLKLNNNAYRKTFNVKIDKNTAGTQSCYLIDGNKRLTLNLPFGIYTFDCSHNSNFYNPMFFSTLSDGIHHNTSNISNSFDINNRDVDYNYIYNKNVYRNKIPGTQGATVTIIIDATTPQPLYYYCKNFNNMGGIINITSNITLMHDVISRDNMLTLNGKVTSINIDICSNDLNGNEIDLSNTVFLKLKDSSNNKTDNIIGITQKNFINNVVTDTNLNKIIFMKDTKKIQLYNTDNYNNQENLSNINSTIGLNNNYLLDISLLAQRSYLTNIDTQLLEISGQYYQENRFDLYYEIDLNSIFIKTINNYKTFAQRYNFNLDDFNFNTTDFVYLVREYKSNSRFNIYNPTQEQRYLPYKNEKLKSSRLILDNVYDNNITIIAQAYLDIVEYLNRNGKQDEIEYWKSKILTINSKINKRNTTPKMINYGIDNDYIFFEEYNISVFYSQIKPANIPVIIDTPRGIYFFNNSLYMKGNITATDPSHNIEKDILQNRIIFCNTDLLSNSDYITINRQNLHHNISQINQNFIFHKYDTSMNILSNYQVNTTGITLEQTRKDIYNDSLVLFDMSKQYMSIVENLSFTQPVEGTFVEQYNQFDINYTIDNNNFLDNIVALSCTTKPSLNQDNIILSQYNLTGQSVTLTDLQGRHYNETGVFIIDLNDYFDREIYDNIIPYSNINFEYLVYTIEDISYIDNHLFDIYDLDNETYIIYRSKHIDVLNRLRRVLVVYNFYIQFIYYYFQEVFHDVTINDVSYISINFASKESLELVYERAGIIMQDYQVIQDNESINEFYVQIKSQYTVFNELFTNMYKVFTDHYIYFNEITYLDVFKPEDDVIMQLSINYNLFDINFQNIFNEFSKLFNIEDYTKHIKNSNPDFMFDSSNDIVYLQTMLQDFYDVYYELKTREQYYSTKFNLSSRLDFSYNLDMYNSNSIILIFYDLKINYQNINFELTRLIDDVNYKNKSIGHKHDIYTPMDIVTSDIFNDISDISFNSSYIFTNTHTYDTSYNHYINYLTESSSSIQDISNNIKTIRNLYRVLYRSFNDRFKRLVTLLDELYTNNIGTIITQISSYILSGSRILLRSFYSNSIAMKIKIKYNSYLYQNVDLDTIFLDITIPDIIPPEIIPDENKINQLRLYRYKENNDNIYYYKFLNLIKEIRDIDSDGLVMYNRDNSDNPIYSTFIESLTNISGNILDYYCTNIDESFNVVLDIDDYRQVLIDFSEYKQTKNSNITSINIRYIIYDVANNKRGLTIPITILGDTNGPIFYYNQNIVTSQTIPGLVFTEGDNILQSVIDDLIHFFVLDTENPDFNEPITIDDVELYNTSLNLYQSLDDYTSYIVNRPGTYNSIIKYFKKDNDNNLSILFRGITVISKDISQQEKICCYPKANYLDIQHNYKMGSFANRNRELSRIIRLYNK